ncbi:RAD55 family ATPase [Thermococcus sp.]
MELLSTGIERLDSAIGGGFIEDSIFLVIYDTYSYGWALGVKILENRIKEGDFGIIINNSMPVTPLSMELKGIDFDLYSYGEKGDLGIIEVFGSFYGIDYDIPYVYTTRGVDISTYLPKFTELYRKMLKKIGNDRRVTGVNVTLEGLAFLLGEKNMIKILQRNLAEKEKARLTENRKRPLNIFLLNRDRVSKEFVSWISLYSQYIVEFRSTLSASEEMFVRKSPLPDFEPRRYEFRIKRGKIMIRQLSQEVSEGRKQI